jgi:hypothetical protein
VRISNNVVTAGTTHEERETRRRKEYEAELRRQQEYLKRREALRKQQAQYYAQYGGSPYSYGPPSMAYGRRPMGMMGGRMMNPMTRPSFYCPTLIYGCGSVLSLGLSRPRFTQKLLMPDLTHRQLQEKPPRGRQPPRPSSAAGTSPPVNTTPQFLDVDRPGCFHA